VGWFADGMLNTENRTHTPVIMGTGEYTITGFARVHTLLTKLTGPIRAVFPE